jgi:hypothetical protein
VESDLQDISYESSVFNRARTSGAIGAKMADKHESKTKKLMATHEKRDFNQLDDFLFTVAESIEEAFLRAGAQPGKDYNYRDLFTLAAPFALEQWKKDMLVIPFWEELENRG